MAKNVKVFTLFKGCTVRYGSDIDVTFLVYDDPVFSLTWPELSEFATFTHNAEVHHALAKYDYEMSQTFVNDYAKRMTLTREDKIMKLRLREADGNVSVMTFHGDDFPKLSGYVQILTGYRSGELPTMSFVVPNCG